MLLYSIFQSLREQLDNRKHTRRQQGRFLRSVSSVSCLPDHSFKEVLNDKVGLSYHNQQGHMGPRKLEWQTQTQQRHCTGMQPHLLRGWLLSEVIQMTRQVRRGTLTKPHCTERDGGVRRRKLRLTIWDERYKLKKQNKSRTTSLGNEKTLTQHVF